VTHHVLAFECQEKLTTFFVVKLSRKSLGNAHAFQEGLAAGGERRQTLIQKRSPTGHGTRLPQEEVHALRH
jgi:hypothetical protein